MLLFGWFHVAHKGFHMKIVKMLGVALSFIPSVADLSCTKKNMTILLGRAVEKLHR